MKLIIINGPNLNLVGVREPEIYGNKNMDEFIVELNQRFPNIEIEYFQNNSEGILVDKIHEVGFSFDGIILNAGAYSHTSIAIADAISSIKTPVVEIHISNTFAREEFRQKDLLSGKCEGLIVGLGLEGYALAIEYFWRKAENNQAT